MPKKKGYKFFITLHKIMEPPIILIRNQSKYVILIQST